MSSVSATNGKAAVDRRQALIDAAITVIAERGLRGFTYRAVAQEAGVTHGLVQHYFGTLETLLEETLTVAFQRDQAEAPAHASHGVDEIVERLPAHVDETRAQQAFQYEVLIESLRRHELEPRMRGIYLDYVSAMQQRLRRAGLPDDPALGRVVFAAVDGLVLQRLLFPEPGEMEAGLEWLREMLDALRERVVTAPPP
jgi:AcrR family transcriptional regulator